MTTSIQINRPKTFNTPHLNPHEAVILNFHFYKNDRMEKYKQESKKIPENSINMSNLENITELAVN